jgi:uncharacterized protein (TIGR02118 family)
MIKVSVIYPNSDGKSFDMDYYCNKHVPMVLQLMGDACKGSAIEAGLSGIEPGSPAPYRAMGHLYFDSVAAFAESLGPHAAVISGDIPNYTDIQPLVQISEVMR